VRAYLTYELFGQASFVSPERIINGSQVIDSLRGLADSAHEHLEHAG